MPRYGFRCDACGKDYTLTLTVKERLDRHKCECSGTLKKTFSPPHVAMVPGTYTRYQAELDKKEIARNKRREKAIRRTKKREAEADSLRST